MRRLLKNILLKLINLLEKWEYKDYEFSDKLIDSLDLSNYKIWADTGWEDVSQIHRTKPFEPYEVILENGYKLEGADDHIVFNESMNQVYLKDLSTGDLVQTDKGLQKVVKKNIVSQNKISMYDITVNSSNHRFYSNGILSHNTTTVAAYFAWYMCFHESRNLAILANKQETAKEIVRKVTQVFRGLPFFLKPGVHNLGAMGMRLDNGCMLNSQATSETAQIGFTIHVLYLDEFAHIRQNIARELWRSVYPTLSSSMVSQCIISSTPNGMDNLFYEIWDNAQKGKNSFYPHRVDYWEVPGRDEEWVKKIKANFGEEYFAQEFELKFDTTQNLLLKPSQLKFISRVSQKFMYSYYELEKTDLENELYANSLRWRNDFDPNDDFNENEHRFLISIDIAEGKEEGEKKDKDYNVASFYMIVPKSMAQLRTLREDEIQIKNMFRMEQIGLYRDNDNDEEIMAKVLQSIVFEQFNEEICKLLVEMNFNGKNFVNKFADYELYYPGLMVHTHHTKPIPGEKPPRKKIGFKVTKDKSHYCQLGRKLIGKKTLVPTSKTTVREYKSFGRVKNSWKGIGKHDDTVMTDLNTSRFYEEPEYSDWLYDFLEQLPDSENKRYIQRLLKEPYDENDINDEMFNALYLEQSSAKDITQLFEESRKNQGRFKPGITSNISPT
ncbi:MAG: terminase large subunit domain-containing protein [bacterium]